MSVKELIPALHELGRADKILLLQFLERELVEEVEEEEPLLKADASYPVWSPHNAFDAENTLLDLLKADAAANLTHAK